MIQSLLAPAGLASDSPPPAPEALERRELTEQDLSAFLDGFLPAALERGDIAGAVVVVVKDGAILLQRGYGYADVVARQPVDPERTLFRVGSVSKLITWTAVMQLVERGLLDLDRDVNEYLDFEIRSRFDKPVTLRHLLTHTAGFEETIRDFFYEDPARLTSLGRYLKENVPALIFEPGTVVAYSNYGAALAGYVVERVAGQPFNDYAQRHILEPLGMRRSTLEQPPPSHLESSMSKGYDRASDREPGSFEIGQAWPAGSLSTTGADIARFMIAHLNGGELAGARILEPETAHLMHTQAYSVAPAADVNGMALGFYQEDRNGWRVLSHAGDTRWFHSNLNLVLDAGVGLFISMNSSGREGASDAIRFSLFHAFMDRYFPPMSPTPTPPTLASALQRGRELAGSYLGSRRIVSNYLSIMSVFAQTTVSVDEAGVLEIAGVRGFDGRPLRWQAVGEDVWHQVDGQAKLAVARDERGRVSALVTTDGPPVVALQPAPWYVNKSWTLPAVAASLAILILAVVSWPVAALVRRNYNVRLSHETARASLIVRVTSLVNALFMAAWLWLVLTAGSHMMWFNDDLDFWLRLLQLFGLLGLAGAAYVTVAAVRAWRGTPRHWWSVLGWSAVGLACAVVAWFAITFKMLSLSLR